MAHRNCQSALTRFPGPHHQLVRRQVLDELIEVAIPILLRVLNRTANLSVREAFPDHRCGWRWQPPIRGARWHVCAGEIVVLMARGALLSGSAVTLWASSHIHGVWMTVVSLAREVTARMAVHAAWMAQH
jgi:hypothetical protein